MTHPSSCMLLNHGSSQQSSKEEYKPRKWGATARYYTSHTKTMYCSYISTSCSILPSSPPSATFSKWMLYHNANCSGMVMFPVQQVWPKPSCKAQRKGEEDKADRGRGGKTTSGNGQAWCSASPRGQWKTGKNGENWLQQRNLEVLWTKVNWIYSRLLSCCWQML